jgi:A/G-specific adenine glycosylase
VKRVDISSGKSRGAPISAPASAHKTRRGKASSDSGLPESAAAPTLDPAALRRRLAAWYKRHARPLPWRATSDPYRIWVSEIMLQQTRVAAVVDHYHEFLRRFPSLLSLALAHEADVLAAWSGLGYYRRARMLHKAAQFIVLERDGRLPTTAAELRTLPGIGEYTAAAIASIAFGESIAVVDGNVERVILRLTGRAQPVSDGGAAPGNAKAFIRAQAQALLPITLNHAQPATGLPNSRRSRPASIWDANERMAIAAAAHPTGLAGDSNDARNDEGTDEDGAASRPTIPTVNAPGDHNQAMMELGATICLPRAPLCLQCPVYPLCRTRGEHPTAPRAPQLSRPAAYLLDLRKRGTATEVLLERRPADATLMPAMYELPPLPLDAVDGREPVLRVRHSITNTNYYVQVFAPRPAEPRSEATALRRAIPADAQDLHWVRTSRLATIPLTGLARKILHRLKVMDNPSLALLE